MFRPIENEGTLYGRSGVLALPGYLLLGPGRRPRNWIPGGPWPPILVVCWVCSYMLYAKKQNEFMQL